MCRVIHKYSILKLIFLFSINFEIGRHVISVNNRFRHSAFVYSVCGRLDASHQHLLATLCKQLCMNVCRAASVS